MSTRGRLTLCRASAGTGKTYSICEWIANQVIHDGLDPARVLATTFTIEAAAELKSRIQSRLLAHSDAKRAHEWAARLEMAAIGTVDAVGYRLLGRYALTLGLSPRLSVLPEDATGRVLAQVLARMDPAPWEALGAIAHRIGGKEPEKLACALLELKRENAIDDARFVEQMVASAQRFCEIASPAGTDATAPNPATLPELSARTLESVAAVGDTTQATAKAIAKLRDWSNKGEVKWEDLAAAARITAGKRSGADAKLNELRALGESVRRQPGLHEDLIAFNRQLAEQTIALEQTFAAFKGERGWVDFTDLEVEFLRLLHHPETSAAIAEEFEVAVVDEFQDTNPLQLAIFERLRELVDRSYWVGDPKQAIYSFRGTDPVLLEETWESDTIDETAQLTVNRRSQAHLVEFVCALFEPEFGDDVIVSPHRSAAADAVETWEVDAKRYDDEARALTEGVLRLLHGDTTLGDIAILVRTNIQAQRVGEAFRQRGIAAVVELPGFLRSREAILALAGLRLVADRWDSLAAATLLHWWDDVEADANDPTLAPEWLRTRLAETHATKVAKEQDPSARSGTPFADDPVLALLDPIRDNRNRWSPHACLSAVIQALRLPARVQHWSNPDERLVHLDSLLAHAVEYERTGHQDGQPITLTGLIEFLEHRRRENDDIQLRPRGLDAVTISTYHGAKGLQWPTVILSGLDNERGADLFDPVAEGRAAPGADPLSNRHVRFWPWPLGINQRTGGPVDGVGLLDDTAATPEGVEANTKHHAESMRLLYVGMTRARDRLVLAYRAKRTSWLDKLGAWSQVMPKNSKPGEHTITVPDPNGGREAKPLTIPLTVRRFSGVGPAPEAAAESRRALEIPFEFDVTRPRVESPPAVVSPSQLGVALASGVLLEPRSRWEATEEIELGPPLSTLRQIEAVEPETFGNILHGYFAALPSLRAVAAGVRESVAERQFRAHGIEPPPKADRTLAEAGERLRRWIDREYPNAKWKTETPIHGPRSGVPGGEWRGIIDLLLELPDGRVVLIDHKSAEVDRTGWRAVAAQHAAQIGAYSELIDQLGETLAAAWIHLPVAGGLVRLEPSPGGTTEASKFKKSGRPGQQLEFEFE